MPKAEFDVEPILKEVRSFVEKHDLDRLAESLIEEGYSEKVVISTIKGVIEEESAEVVGDLLDRIPVSPVSDDVKDLLSAALADALGDLFRWTWEELDPTDPEAIARRAARRTMRKERRAARRAKRQATQAERQAERKARREERQAARQAEVDATD